MRREVEVCNRHPRNDPTLRLAVDIVRFSWDSLGKKKPREVAVCQDCLPTVRAMLYSLETGARMAAEVSEEAVRDVLKRHPEGITAKNVARAVGGRASVTLALMHKLRTEGAVRRTGKQSTTRWFLK